jgi:hypothetical protein
MEHKNISKIKGLEGFDFVKTFVKSITICTILFVEDGQQINVNKNDKIDYNVGKCLW